MIKFEANHNTIQAAKEFDNKDELSKMRNNFHFPLTESGDKALYFTGHSLGLMPKKAQDYIEEELNAWKAFGVEGHFKGKHPWLPYHEFLTEQMAEIVGGKTSEVVVMNSLTVNLHLMLVSFYRPTQKRFKILIENTTFPSDKYAVDSQARYHGFNPEEAIVQLQPSDGKMTLSDDELVEQIKSHGDSLSLVMLGNCNYLSGQCFNFEKVVQAAKEVGAMVGFNLAHGAGNIILDLHKVEADFAVWCTYKYLNSGPGGLAGAFVHEKHLKDPTIPRFEGWWGTKKETRFKMKPNFEPMDTVESWQLSNPPIFQLAAIRASLDLYSEAGFKNLRAKGDNLTGYLEWLLKTNSGDQLEIVTPAFEEGKQTRGSMLCVRVKGNAQAVEEKLKEHDAIVDFREPDILRMAPIPLYNSFEDVYELADIINKAVK
jgi:kynureninase